MTFAAYAQAIVALVSSVVVPIIFGLAFVFFVWGIVNYFFLSSESDDKRAQGRQFALWGLLGMVVLFSVWGIVRVLLSTLGITPIAH